MFVRRGGFFKRVTRTPLRRKEALAFGRVRVGTTPAASFRIVKAKRGGLGKFAKRGIPSDFYKGSKTLGKDVFIEKRGRRIKSFGELAGITYKGIAASKAKRGGGWGF